MREAAQAAERQHREQLQAIGRTWTSQHLEQLRKTARLAEAHLNAALNDRVKAAVAPMLAQAQIPYSELSKQIAATTQAQLATMRAAAAAPLTFEAARLASSDVPADRLATLTESVRAASQVRDLPNAYEAAKLALAGYDLRADELARQAVAPFTEDWLGLADEGATPAETAAANRAAAESYGWLPGAEKGEGGGGSVEPPGDVAPEDAGNDGAGAGLGPADDEADDGFAVYVAEMIAVLDASGLDPALTSGSRAWIATIGWTRRAYGTVAAKRLIGCLLAFAGCCALVAWTIGAPAVGGAVMAGIGLFATLVGLLYVVL
ncbi:hypothetical protein F1C76_13280 [Geodermatophilaceae bacterium NBWT11]|nr:hypothetical protein F1C76_13280 [Geodermatophilaceae bacterium NBWT11]